MTSALGLRGRPASRRRNAAAATLAVAAAVALMAACGDSGSNAGTQPFRARTAPGVSLAATLTLTGSTTLTATFTDEISDAAAAPTCADAVNGFAQDTPRYAAPRTPQTATYGGHTVRILAEVVGYHGAAEYPGNLIVGDDGTQGLIAIDNIRYGIVTNSGASLAVKPDDSGTLTMVRLGIIIPPTPTPTPGGSGTPKPAIPPASPPPSSISGTLTWTCATLRPPSPTPKGTAPAATLPVTSPSVSSLPGASSSPTKPGATKAPGTPTPSLPH